MAQIVELKSFNSNSGELTVIEKLLPGSIKRIFYIQNTSNFEHRGGHRHISSHHAMVCLQGNCEIYVQNEDSEQTFQLNNPQTSLILEPKDWRIMKNFSNDAILLIISNQYYDINDYIDEPYNQTAIASL